MRCPALPLLLTACATTSVPVAPPAPGVEQLSATPTPTPTSRQLQLAAALDELEPELRAAAERTLAPGVAVGVVVDGRLAWVKGYGQRDVDAGAPVDADTVFRIASMSKAFVAEAALKLRDEGRLRLDEPVQTALPELASLRPPTDDSPPVTTRLLLSHAAGFPEDNASADLRMPMSDEDFTRVLRAGLSFSTTPGTRFEYANLGFALAGRVVSRAAGMPAQAYITQALLQPLGMGQTVWDVRQVDERHRAHGYGRRDSPMPSSGLSHFDDDLPHEELTLADGSWAPLGGLWTSPRDYAKWVAFQLAAWPPRDGPELGPVRRASVREAHSLQRFAGLSVASHGGQAEGRAGGYGFGWGVASTCAVDHLAAHSGGLPGYGSHVRLLLDQGIGIFTMTNLTYQGAFEVVDVVVQGLSKRGLLDPPRQEPSRALVDASSSVLSLLARFDAAALEAVVDRTYLVYQAPARVQERWAALSAQLGRCRAVSRWVVENQLRGTATVECERGLLDLRLELTHEVPARLQAMDLKARLALRPELRTRLDGWVAGAVPTPGGKLEALRAKRGHCQVVDAASPAGGNELEAFVACERGSANLVFVLDQASATVRDVRVAEPDGGRCH